MLEHLVSGRGLVVARRVSQAAFFVLFLATLVFSTSKFVPGGYVLRSPVSGSLWPRLSVFSAVVTMLAERALNVSFWPAILLVIMAAVKGRAFCGWACPLGTSIDVFDHLFLGKPQSPAATAQTVPARRFKYYVLLAGVAAAVFGTALLTFLDPLSIVVRFYASLLDLLVWAAAGLLEWLSRLPVVGGAAQSIKTWAGLAPAVSAGGAFTLLICFSLVFGPPIIALISRRKQSGRRFWCRHLCPLGAALGLIGRWVLVRRSVKEGCISCGRCVASCPTACISEDAKSVLEGECTLCALCAAACPKSCISFLPTKGLSVAVRAGAAPSEQSVDSTRRDIIGGILVGIGAAAGAHFFRGSGKPEHLRPPGAGEEDAFLDKCVRCGACVRVCPKNALHADYHRAGLAGLGAPVLIPRLGYCAYDCNLCGAVCPSGAIPNLPLPVKRSTPMGAARYRKDICLPWMAQKQIQEQIARGDSQDFSWVQGYFCQVCWENCPVPEKAIKVNEVHVGDGLGLVLGVPYIDDTLCIGCGRCEYVCPLKGRAGVHVIRREHAANYPA